MDVENQINWCRVFYGNECLFTPRNGRHAMKEAMKADATLEIFEGKKRAVTQKGEFPDPCLYEHFHCFGL
jgi:hypothetical protein